MNFLSVYLSRILTENGLFRAWKKHISPLNFKDWKGIRSNYLSEEEAVRILAAFLYRRDENFFLFFRSDYKYTYIGRNLLKDGKEIYLKHYKVYEAPAKIRWRNIFRKTIARKGLNLYYVLKEKGIGAVCPLFYTYTSEGIVPHEAIFASRSAESNKTLEVTLKEGLEKEKLYILIRDLGTYIGTLHTKGILHGELHRNLIPLYRGNTYSFLLCDLDEMRSVSGMSERHRQKYLKTLRRKIEKHDKAFLLLFDEKYRESLSKKFLHDEK